MDNEILADIIVVEKEIRACVDAAVREGEDRLAQLRAELAEELAAERQRLAQEREETLDAAREEARQRADAILRDAAGRAERLASLDAGLLTGKIVPFLQRLRPGEPP